MNINIEDTKHIKLALRRGMLELDILLSGFFESGYQKLSDTEKTTFIKLLETPDPDLFAWLMGQVNPDDQALSALVEKIRKT